MNYKILMIAPTPFFSDRGCHVRIYEEIRALQKIGHQITLCTYPLGHDMDMIDIRRSLKIPWYKKLEAGPTWHKFYLDHFLYKKTLKVLEEEPFDLIHAHLHEGVFIAGRLKKHRPLPIIADFQGSMTDEIRSHEFAQKIPGAMRGFLWLEKRINRIPQAMILSSKQAAEIFRKDFFIPSEKIIVVPDGVDTEVFSHLDEDRQEIRMQLGIGNDRLVIVFIGLLNPYQGIDILLNVMPKVIEKVANAHFLIMGFPNEKHYKKICSENGFASHVTFTGRIPYLDAKKYLACGDVAISPKISKTEGNGKLMNYMAMGLPTVVFESDVNREILGEYGIYAHYANEDDFSQKLIALLKDAEKRNPLGQRLRDRAIQEFSWDKRAKQITQIYQQALSELRVKS